MKPVKNTSMQDMEGEQWFECRHYEGIYEVSNKGRVKSVERVIITVAGVKRKIKPCILKQELKNRSGGHKSYARVCLCKEGTEYNIAVHKLMAMSNVKLKK